MLRPPVTWRSGAAPAASPLAWWERHDGEPSAGSAGRVGLGLPGLGRVLVSDEGIEVVAPDAAERARTWDCLGEWALAQWWARHGHWVVRGSVIAREGGAVILTGGPRCGASLLALAMTSHGWSVVSDGVVAVDGDGMVRSSEPGVLMDAVAAARLAPDRVTPLSTTRPRVRVQTVWHDDAPVVGLALLTKSQRVRRLSVTRLEDHEQLRRALLSLTVRPDLPAPPIDPPSGLPCWRVQRPEQLAADDPRTTPGPMAAALDAVFPMTHGARR